MPEAPLEELLSLFLEHDEVAPGIVRIYLSLGEHRLGMQARYIDGRLSLRAFPLDAMPPELARNPLVREKIVTFGDVLKTGKVFRDDAARPFVEMDLGRGDGGKEAYLKALEALSMDCVRLRGAAEGLLAATAEPAAAKGGDATQSSAEKTQVAPPPKKRLWDVVLEKQMPGAHLAELTRKHRKSEPALPVPPAAALTPSKEEAPSPAPVAALKAPAAPPPVKPAAPAPPEPVKPAAREMWEAIAPGDALLADVAKLPTESPPPEHPGPTPSLMDELAPAAEEEGPRDRRGRNELVEKSAFTDSIASMSPNVRETAQEATRERDEFAKWLADLGDEESVLAPEGTPMHSVPDVSPPRRKRASLIPDVDEKAETGGESGRRGKLPAMAAKPREEPKPRDEPPAPPSESSRRRRSDEPTPPPSTESSRRQKPRDEAQFEEYPALQPIRRSKPGPPREEAPSEPPRRPKPEPEPRGGDSSRGPRVREPLPDSDERRESPSSRRTDTSAHIKKDPPRKPGPRGGEGGDDLLSWMDDVEPGTLPDASHEAEAHTRRRSSLSIPRSLLPQLRKVLLEWYRRPDRELSADHLKRGADEIFIMTGTEPGEVSWRYARPLLRLGRPPVEAGACVFYHEPQDLTTEEVEAWLLSEQLVEENEVRARHKAGELRAEAWQKRADGDVQGAISCLVGVLEFFPGDIQALAALGHLNRKELEKPEESLAFYEKALEEAPRYAPALLGRAALMVERDRHRAAEEAVQALALSPRDPDALELAGIVTLKANRKARARELFLRLYRLDRPRGERALALIDPERAGEAKWDPRLVIWERDALAAAAAEESGATVDPVTLALFKERVEVADALDAYIRDYKTLSVEDRRRRLERLAETPSYSFLGDLIDLYREEESDLVRGALEAAFLRAPTQAGMALEDALTGDDFERAAAAIRIAAKLQWADLVRPALETYQRVRVGRHVATFSAELVHISGPEVALALLAKLERGAAECRDAILKLLEQRPSAPAEEAAHALQAVLDEQDAVQLEPGDRAVLEKALKPPERPRRNKLKSGG